MALGLIEGDFSSSSSHPIDAQMGHMPQLPDMNKEYLFFLSYIEPSENMQEGLIHGNDLAKNDIFYLAPGQPAKKSCNIYKVLAAGDLAEQVPPVTAPTPSLPLPGNTLSLDAANAQAETIEVAHVVSLVAFFGNSSVVKQAINVQILKTVRGKARGGTQYNVPIDLGKEAIPELGRNYLFFLSHYGAVLKIAPANSLSALPGAGHAP